MKNKKLTYLLILVVAVVWGIIIRRVVSYTEPEHRPPVQPAAGRDIPQEPPGYALILDYRDPFLEEKTPQAPAVRENASSGPVREAEPPPESPDIRFMGVIRQGGKGYAILHNAADTEILRPGESIDGFLISIVGADSVVLKKRGHTFVLKPQ